MAVRPILFYPDKRLREPGQPVEVFDDALRVQAVRRQQTESDLRAGMDRGELRVHYQPIVDADTTQPRGFEALVRWQHPSRGLLAPAAFLSIAEESGLITDLGVLVLDQALGDLHRLRALHGNDDLYLAINVSPRQLTRSDFVATLRDLPPGTAPHTRWR